MQSCDPSYHEAELRLPIFLSSSFRVLARSNQLSLQKKPKVAFILSWGHSPHVPASCHMVDFCVGDSNCMALEFSPFSSSGQVQKLQLAPPPPQLGCLWKANKIILKFKSFHFTPVRMSMNKNTSNRECWHRWRQKGVAPIPCRRECKPMHPL